MLTTEVFTLIGTRALMESIHAQQDNWRAMIRQSWPKQQYAICYQETLTPGRPPRVLLTVRATIASAGPLTPIGIGHIV